MAAGPDHRRSGDPVDHTSPPTTQPARARQCDGCVFTDFAYSVRRCEQGWDVQLTQTMLGQRGFDVDVDGYFGPAIQQAVHGGAPAAKRGRTTLTDPRAGAQWLWAEI